MRFPNLLGRIVFGLCSLAFPISSPSQAQSLASIKGNVLDSSQQPIAGVQIFLHTSKKGAITGLDGRFEINGITPGPDKISVRFVGYETIEQTVHMASGQALKLEFELVEEPISMQGIAVSATRELQNKSDIAASIGSVGKEKIADMNPSHPAQIMGLIPGVLVSITGGEGHMTSIRQPLDTNPVYLFLENGVPTRSTGFFNHNALYEINIPQADGIEVIKGPGTALYGSDAIGGVINVTSGAVPSSTTAGGTIEGGSFGWKRGLFSAGGSRGGNGVRLDVNLTDSEGWRNNSSYSRQSGTLRWDRRLGSRSLVKTLASYSNIDQGPAGGSAVSEADYNANPELNYTPISFRKVGSYRVSSAYERYSERSLLSVTPFFRFSSMDILPNWSLSYDPAIWETQNYSFGTQVKYRMDFDKMDSRLIVGADLDYSPGSHREFKVNAVREGKIYTSYTDAEDQYDYDVTFQEASPFAHFELTPATNVRVTAGLRLDLLGYDYSNNMSVETTGSHRRPASDTRSYAHVSPKLGVTYQASNRLNMFASYRHAFRVPSEGQLFRQGSSINSIDLTPVKADNLELGLRGQLVKGVNFDVTGYSMVKNDDIVSFVYTDGTQGSVNTGKTSHKGVELGVELAPLTGLSLSTAYTYAVHRFEEWETRLGTDFSGNEMDVAPRVILNAEIAYKIPVLDGAAVAIEWNKVGSYWMDPNNTSKYDGHNVFNLRASLNFLEKVTFLARVGNITDELFAERATHNAFRGDEFAPGSPRTINVSLRYGL